MNKENIIETVDSFCCDTYTETESPYLKRRVIYKNALEKFGGCTLDFRDALRLFNGQEIKVQLRSKKTGRYYWCPVHYDFEKERIEVDFSKSKWR